MAKYDPSNKVVCPHCLVTVKLLPIFTERYNRNNDHENTFDLTIVSCPSCKNEIISLEIYGSTRYGVFIEKEYVIYPFSSSRPPTPTEVPKSIAEDYLEASLVLSLSPKASAALSRRCLQHTLKEAGGFPQNNLSDQIDHAIPTLPSYIQRNLDIVREIGNFAAHPLKDTNSGAIIEVEQGEAEWNLEVVEQLFDHYYVQPELSKNRKAEVNKKLEAAGKKIIT